MRVDLLRRRLRPRLMLLAFVATLGAAALVLFYQYKALTTQQSQTRVILRQMSEQTAVDIGNEIRRTLNGPVQDTLLGVTHPELREGRMDRVAEEYRKGLEAYPQVQSFFVWSKETEAIAPGEAMFYERELRQEHELYAVSDGARFTRNPALGQKIVEIARRSAYAQHIYAADELGPDGPHLFLRLYWSDARRVEYYAVLGYVVVPSKLPEMFEALYKRSFANLLSGRGGDMPLSLRVTDESGRVVYGPQIRETEAAGVGVSMDFYPVARIESRLVAGKLTPRMWRVEVYAPVPARGLVQTYLPTIASVLLMLIGFGLTVQANRRADDLARMQAEFIAYASHQLKTPLSLISAATETVEMAHVRSPEKLSQYLGIIRNEVTRLSSLVQRILEFSRLQQSRSYEFEVIDLGVLVHETVEAFESSLGGRQFVFRVEQEGPSPSVLADPAAIEQVLANLLDNAVKYSGESREVRVRLSSTASEACIEVIDRGPGLTERDRSRIFDKFYRGSASSSELKGFGLGLPIVHELVSVHRGRIVVDSAPGRGSTFRVTLPAVRADRAELTAPRRDSVVEPREAS